MGRSTGKEGIPGKGLAWGRGRGYRVGIEGGGVTQRMCCCFD